MHIDINAGGIINKDKKSSATIWIPIIGFDKKFTLRISPKSHKKNHGNKFKKTKKISPMLPKSYCNKFKFTRFFQVFARFRLYQIMVVDILIRVHEIFLSRSASKA